MEPASVIGVIGVVAQVIQAIYAYGEAVLECKNEVAHLRAELFGMHAALTQIEQDLAMVGEGGSQSLASPNLRSLQSQQMLDETRAILEKLAGALKYGLSRPHRLVRRLVRPLKRSQVQALATHLERLKTFFILTATKDTLQAAQDTKKSIHTLRNTIQDIQQTKEEESVYLDAMKWLAPCTPHIAHAAALSARLAGTNSWFLEEAFCEWTVGTTHILWLKGKPGSGKTCLTAACTDKLLRENRTVPYFYCSYNDLSSQEPRNILGSLIAQLCGTLPTARHLALRAYSEAKSRSSLHYATDIPMLVDLMRSIIHTLSTETFIVIDAADECGDNLAVTLQALFQVLTSSRWARLILSSTEKIAYTIQKSISEYELTLQVIALDISTVSSDINTYINTRFAQDSKLKGLQHELRVSLVRRIQKQHEGSFRWTRCTIDDLTRRRTPKAIKNALDGVAPTLGDIYLGILRGIPSDMVQAAASVLQYLVSALRQLSLTELTEAVSFTFSDDFGEDDRLIEPEAILRSLHSLVHHDPSSQRVELAHSSVRDFLTSREFSGQYYVDPIAANISMSQICIHYLTLPQFHQTCPDQTALETRKEDWPFFEYASLFWTRHTRRCVRMSDEHLAVFSKLAASSDLPGDGNLAAWYQCVYPQGDMRVWTTKPLYMCAREGLIEPLKVLLTTGIKDQLEQRGGVRGSTALHVAATYGEAEAVKLLLGAGADVNEPNAAGESGIQWASFWKHEQTVRLLLEAGASSTLLEHGSNPVLQQQMVQHSLIPSSRYAGTEESDIPGPL